MMRPTLAYLVTLLLGPASILAQAKGLPVETVVQTATAPLTRLKFSSDGKWMVSQSGPTAIIWEVASGRQIRRILGPAGQPNASLSPAGKYLIFPEPTLLSSSPKTILYEVATGNIVHTFDAHTVTIGPGDQQVALNPYRSRAAKRSDVEIYDLNSLLDPKIRDKKLHKFKKAIHPSTAISISPDGKYAAFMNTELVVDIWDLALGKKIRSVEKKGIGYHHVEFVPGGGELALTWYTLGNTQIDFWDTSSWKITTSLKGFPTDPNPSFGPDGKYVITKTYSKDYTKWETALWEISTGKKIRSIDTFYAALAPSGNIVISAIGIFNLTGNLDFVFKSIATWEDTRVFKGIPLGATGIFFGPSRKDVTVWSGDKGVVKNLVSGAIISEITGLKNPISFDRTNDGKILVMGYGNTDGSLNARIVARESSSDKTLYKFDGGPGGATATISAKGKYIASRVVLATTSAKGSIPIYSTTSLRIIDVAAGTEKLMAEYVSSESILLSLAMSPDEKYLATIEMFITYDASERLKLSLWDLATGKLNRNLSIKGAVSVFGLGFSPDGSLIASSTATISPAGTVNYQIDIWEVSSGNRILRTTSDKPNPNIITSIKFNNDGSQIAAGSRYGGTRLYSVKEGKLIKSFSTASGLSAIEFSENANHLIAVFGGKFSIFSISTGKSVINMQYIGTEDWIVTTPDGRFDVTEGAKQYIHFVRGTEVYELDQFFEEFYTPGLLAQVMGGGELALPKVDIAEKLSQSPPPTVEIISPRPSDKLTSKTVEVQVKVTDTGGGIDEVKLLHNGKRIGGDTRGMKRQSSGNTVTRTYQITLVQGTNEFIASAFSTGRIESRGYRLEVLYTGAAKTATSYLLAVGINTYKNSRLNLNYARADASAFVELVAEKSKQLFQDVHVTTLYDTEATRPAVLAALDDIAGKAGPEDVFTFYYAGHGSVVDNQFYFVTSENVRLYDREKLDANAIPARMLQEKFARIKALKQLIVMDACQSGAATELLAVRGAAEEKALAQLARSAGVHVLASAGTEQFATEFAELGHGAFTYVLLEALKGGADGSPKDGKVTIYELKSYLDDQVPELTAKYKGQAQYPNTFSKGQDFPVVME